MAEHDEAAIRVSNVSKVFKLPHEKNTSVKSAFVNFYRKKRSFEKQQALKDISFEVKKGEFFGIVGRNGSGKSTLLKIIANIYQPTSGTLEVSGKLVPFIELGVGFNPELTGRENVFLNGALLGFSEKEVQAMYKDIVEFAELQKFMDQKLKNYSSGMQVRLAFSMAIRAKADILLIDEVLAVGDAAFQRKCYEFFRNLKKQKTTVVFVSHDMDAIRRFCDRAIMIEDSRITESGSVEEIADNYTKMFLREAQDVEAAKIGDRQSRWGNQKAIYTSVKISGTKHDSSEVTITASIACKETIQDVSLGFLVKNFSNQIIMGTNNKRQNLKLNKLESGKKYSMRWTMPQIFNEGEYSIDLSASYEDGEIADRWEGATTFKMFTPKATPFLVDPKVNLEFNEESPA